MGCLFKRLITFNNAIKYCDIKIYNEINIDITNECNYSWSTDGVCWTPWTSFQNFNNIAPNLESDFYFRILIFGGLDRVEFDGLINKCYNICLYDENPFLNDFCENENLFNPYTNLDCALQLQQQLSDSIVCMFGIPIYYIKTEPNNDTVDYTFKEYVLHNVVDIKQMKLMVQDGTMPSSKPMMTDFDFDWEVDWETEISKSQFAKAFGDTAVPHINDFIYIPMMHRLWDVNSAYDEKQEGLMWRSTTWKLALTKYSDSYNVDTNNFSDIIDGWVKNKYDDVFGRKERLEQERQTAEAQIESPKFAATNLTDIFLQDAMRKQVTKQDLIIKTQQLNNRSMVIAKNMYKFKNQNGCITYQNKFCSEDGSILLILEFPGKVNPGEYSLLDFGNTELKLKYEEGKYILMFNGLEQELEGFKTYMINLQWSRQNFITNMIIYEYKYPSDIPVYMLKPEKYYFDFENPVCNLTKEYNNDWIYNEGVDVQLHTYPLLSTNFKLYNVMLGEDIIKESMKYTTKHNSCVINDLARVIDDGHGYDVK